MTITDNKKIDGGCQTTAPLWLRFAHTVLKNRFPALFICPEMQAFVSLLKKSFIDGHWNAVSPAWLSHRPCLMGVIFDLLHVLLIKVMIQDMIHGVCVGLQMAFMAQS